MVQVLKGKAVKGVMGYLTYPISDDELSKKLMDFLLGDYIEHRWYAGTIVNGRFKEYIVKAAAAKELSNKEGWKTRVQQFKNRRGRESLEIIIDGEKIKLEVKKGSLEIHMLKKGYKIYAIRARVSGDALDEVTEYMKAIKKSTAKWHIKPKACVWTHGKWHDLSEFEKPVSDEKKIAKDDKRLEEIIHKHEHKIEELQEQVNDLRNIPLKNSVVEEREAKAGVLK